MRNRSTLSLLLGALVVLALVFFGGPGLLGRPTETTTPAPASSAPPLPGPNAQATPGTAPAGTDPARPVEAVENPSGLPSIPESSLPAEGRRVLALIRAGGPFQYSQDDQAFGNFERILPRRDRGYYREYTVPTPGERDRGARRIVAGDGGEKYYTDDHYESFRFIAEGS
ncbi:guanyl-specific ribonuclease [Arthrobacter sp. AD-310]